MSDELGYEVIDASQVEYVRGRRNKLGNGDNFIPAPVFGMSNSDRKVEYQYYKALQTSWKRRNGVTETPYDHLIDPRFEKEEEYARLFPVTLTELRLIVQEEEMKKSKPVVQETPVCESLVACECCGLEIDEDDAVHYETALCVYYICTDCHYEDYVICSECELPFVNDEDDLEICESCREDL